ncbi:MAG: hypothetical protein JZU63_02765, partial [Rhodoferax sp.]|nr:hypothetical protein [Rhodoferax sp.]
MSKEATSTEAKKRLNKKTERMQGHVKWRHMEKALDLATLKTQPLTEESAIKEKRASNVKLLTLVILGRC